jgi:predicted NUDIX family NTP pyrophosphohydrolase
MSGKQSAGILAYRFRGNTAEVLLAHPGGPFWQNKDAGVWSIPKGEFEPGEDAFTAARREWNEETNLRLSGNFIPLSPVRQKSGKTVLAWAVECDTDLSTFRSNTFETEWPPRSGKLQSFPEVDRVSWFTLEEAKEKINPGQVPLIEELESRLKLQARKV